MIESSEVLRAALLGMLQGATEFLPVSSSGHLVILPELVGWPPAGLTFDVVVHIATAVAVLIAFRQDWRRMIRGAWRGLRSGDPLGDPDARLLAMLVLASVPAAVAGLALESYVESWLAESSLAAARLAGSMLLVTGTLLVTSERFAARGSSSGPGLGARGAADRVGWGTALLIGVAQAIAIVPGISRSGATIAAGLALGLPRDEAARFSFLLATPIILGAGALRLIDLADGQAAAGPAPLALVIGAVSAFVVGWASIGWLMRIVRSRSLVGFALYTWAFGLLALWMLR